MKSKLTTASLILFSISIFFSCGKKMRASSYEGSLWTVSTIDIENNKKSEKLDAKTLVAELLKNTSLRLMPQGQYAMTYGTVNEVGTWEATNGIPTSLTSNYARKWEISNFTPTTLSLSSKNSIGTIKFSFKKSN